MKEKLEALRQAAIDEKNLMPYVLDCARNYVTLGEMVDELKKVYGVYEESIVF